MSKRRTSDTRNAGVAPFHKPSSSWLGQGGVAFPGLPSGFKFDYYPLVSLLSSGHVFASVIFSGNEMASPWESPSAYIEIKTTFPPTGNWTMVSSNIQTLHGTQMQNANLLYPTGFLWPWRIGQTIGTDRMVIIGGHDANRAYVGIQASDPGSPAESAVWQIQDTSPTTPRIFQASSSKPSGWGSLNIPRVYANVVLLPDLTAFVVGGSRNEFKPFQLDTIGPRSIEVTSQPVYQPELLDLLNPNAGWQLQPPHVSPRLYHAVAVLLKDGRVLVMGGYRSFLSQPSPSFLHSDAEIFSPKYIADGLTRPSIDQAPTELHYGGGAFEVQVSGVPASDIEFATLIRCSSVTHHFDWDQRCIRLEVVASPTDSQVTLTGVPSTLQNGHFIAPPGYYMLHVVRKAVPPDNIRVPSVARFVKVGV